MSLTVAKILAAAKRAVAAGKQRYRREKFVAKNKGKIKRYPYKGKST